MKQTNNDTYYIDSQEAANKCIKYFNMALALNFDDDDLKATINKNLTYANWCLEKHWGKATGETLKWGVILGVGVIICFSIGSATAILIGLAVAGLWVFTGFKEGYKINRNTF